MAKLKQLLESIQENDKTSYLHPKSERCYTREDHRYHYRETENLIEQMTSEDFAVTYDKHPLLRTLTTPKIHLAEMIIKKNPVSAAKISYEGGRNILSEICSVTNLHSDDAFKIVNLLIPYIPQEMLLLNLKHSATFLHTAAIERYVPTSFNPNNKEKNYKIVGAVPPEIINTILRITMKNSEECDPLNMDLKTAPLKLIEFLYEAIHVYDREIAFHPEKADNYFRKGVILQGMGKHEKAIKYYKKAIELDPSYIEKVKEVDLIKITEESHNHKANPELLKSKIDELTKEISKLNEKKLSLASELNKLTISQKVVEEHKGERVDDVPPYEAPSQEEMALMGVEDTCNVTFHA